MPAPSTIAIMQPTFLPWIGYLAMIDRVDTFVILDSVQFDRRSWQQRNQIKTANGPSWLSVPVISKGLRDQKIKDVAIQHDETDALSKIGKTITHAYGKTPYFAEYSPKLLSILENKPALLSDLNMDLLAWLCGSYGIKPNFVKSSTLKTEGAKASLLTDICLQLGAKTYISPPGSKGYIDASTDFSDNGINVVYHTYAHPVYRQAYGDFLPYMSAIDLLFNEGPDGLKILRGGIS